MSITVRQLAALRFVPVTTDLSFPLTKSRALISTSAKRITEVVPLNALIQKARFYVPVRPDLSWETMALNVIVW